METLYSLFVGFSAILKPESLFYCFIGVLIGTLIGVLTGIGPVGTVSLLMPFVYRSSPLSAIVMLAGIYYGAMYGAKAPQGGRSEWTSNVISQAPFMEPGRR